ncbi:MAG: DUF2066 domain-containing protein [Gammaproteobacteria bacterium]
MFKTIKIIAVFLSLFIFPQISFSEIIPNTCQPTVLVWLLEEDLAAHKAQWISMHDAENKLGLWLKEQRSKSMDFKVINPLYDLSEQALSAEPGLFRQEKTLLEASQQYSPHWVIAIKLSYLNQAWELEAWIKNKNQNNQNNQDNQPAQFIALKAKTQEEALNNAWAQLASYLPKNTANKNLTKQLWWVDNIRSPLALKNILQDLKILPGIAEVEVNMLNPDSVVLEVSHVLGPDEAPLLDFLAKNQVKLSPVSLNSEQLSQGVKFGFKYSIGP